eukprot:6190506-Pleurochrysis_carterae.AAC.1
MEQYSERKADNVHRGDSLSRRTPTGTLRRRRARERARWRWLRQTTCTMWERARSSTRLAPTAAPTATRVRRCSA